MVLALMKRRCHVGRSAATRVILVSAVILWTVIFNMVTLQRPGTDSSAAGVSALRSDRSEAVVHSAVSLSEVRPHVVHISASRPELATAVEWRNAPPPVTRNVVIASDVEPSVVRRGAPAGRVVEERSIALLLAAEATGKPLESVQKPTHRGTAEARERALPVETAAAREPARPPALGSVMVQEGASLTATKTVVAEPAVQARPRPGSLNPLSCFTDNSTLEQQHFSEREKAMFRYLFDWPEVPTSSCKRKFKMGGMASGEGCLVDGDKFVCLDEPLSLAAARDDCLVYSFGINYDWSFDEAAEAFGCEVHSFDPSIDYPEGKRSPGITFHHFGIGRNKHINVFGWQIYTLDQIISLLGHQGRTIHYLKMDAEGGEFDMMAQQLLDDEGEFVLDKVEQIGFEVHFKLDPHLQMAFYRRANRSVHAMRELGFNLIHWEYNKVVKERYMFPGVERPTSLLYEILLIRNGPDTWDRSERGRREREVVAALAARAMTLTKSLIRAARGT